MNLIKLFETQATLDEHIMQEHPELRNQDNLDWKILALQVELAECANEWRGFKKWSKDQEPRVWHVNIKDQCDECKGFGYFDKHKDIKDWIFCKPCDGIGYHFHNPLLEEYVDCLHFILSIGLEIGYTNFSVEKMNAYLALISEEERNDLTGHFIAINYITSCIFEDEHHYETALYEILDLGNRLGFTWDQIEDAYYAKNKVNHERQKAGY